MNICLICLRADRQLQLGSTVLREFHDQMCDYALKATMPTACYCSECEYLLAKFYKFKRKCVMAIQVYRNWNSVRESKKLPVKQLFMLLPASPLGFWVSNSNNIGNFTLMEPELQSTCANEVVTKDMYKEDLVHDHIDNNDSSFNIKNSSEQTIDNTINNYIKEEHFENPDELECDFEEFENIKKTSNDDIKEEHFENRDELECDFEEFENIKKPSNDDIKEEHFGNREELECDMEESEKKKKEKNIKKPSKKQEKITKPKVRKETNVSKANKKEESYFSKVLEIDKQYEADFDIEYLRTDEEKLAEFQRRKTYECYENAAHKCEICYQGFTTLKFLKYHTEKLHVETAGKILCPICKIWFPKNRRKHNLHQMVFKCKRCPLITYKRQTMQNHLLWHKGKKYRCEECDLTYKSISVYSLHMAKNHRPRRHVCEACGRGFVSRLGLSVHKGTSFRCAGAAAAKEASQVPPDAAEGVRCDECDVTLSKEVYVAHMADVHAPHARRDVTDAVGDGLPGRKISEKGIVTRPYFRRSKTSEHTCRLCNKVGTTFGWLQRHFKLEHPKEDFNALYLDKKKHLCDVCGAGFAAFYALRDHMNFHTGVRPYACDLCPKRFRTATLRKDHRLRHFPSSFTCTLCGKRFKSNGNLFMHMQVHTEEKNYKCNVCGKAFLHNNNLTQHLNSVHNNIRRVRKRDTKGKLVKSRTRIAEIEAIEPSEVNETATVGTSEATETEAIEMCEDTETIAMYEDIETIEMYEDTETIETSEVAETETMSASEDTKMRTNRKRSFQTYQ